jgi:hypothetical protein
MSDPRHTDPANDPYGTSRRDPIQPGTSRYNVEDDANRGGLWAWIVGIIAVIVIAILVYDYNRPISTATNPSASPPSTTGSAPAVVPAAPPPKSP